MSILALAIAIVALIISILAYQRAGGTADLKKRVEALSAITDTLREKTADTLSTVDLKKRIDTLSSLTDSLREKMADALTKMEKVIRKEGEKKGE